MTNFMTNIGQTKSIIANSAGIIVAVGLIAGGARVRSNVERRPDGPHPNLTASRETYPEANVTDTYNEVSRLIKQEYVESVNSDMKLATGAVRGMVTSLGDPESLFMDKDEFAVFRGERTGSYQGIGAEMALLLPSRSLTKPGESSATAPESPEEALGTSPHIPKLTIVAITPGGAAARAGLRVGDVVDSIDGHWVINSDLIDEFNRARRAFLAHKMSVTEINVIRKRLRAQTEHAMVPIKARQKLIMGTTGSIEVKWKRAGKLVSTSLTRGASHMPEFTIKSDQITLPFTAGSASRLRDALIGKVACTIDLRNNAVGDFDEMRRCLAVVTKSGTYGWVRTFRKEAAVPVIVSKGNSHPPKIRLLVDGSTRGAAEMFALALSKFGGATLSGSNTGQERSVVETVPLPDGTGYSLVTGEYSVEKGAAK